MEFGLYVDARPDIVPIARAVEDAGFTHLWIYDSPLVFSDPTVCMVRALDATTDVVIGPGVANPLQRNAPEAARLVATLSAIAPGRVVFGLGIGNSARRSLGMRPSTIAELVDHAVDVRALIRGQTIRYRESDVAQPIRFIHPEGRWIRVDVPAAVWLSAFGPKGQRAAAAVADGILIRWEGPDRFREVRAIVDEAAADAGRDPDEVAIGVVYSVLPIEHEDELRTPELLDAVGPLVVSRLRYLTANARDPAEVPSIFREGFVAYQRHREELDPVERHLENYRGYLVFTPPDLEHMVTPDAMRSVTHIGSPADVAAELQRMADCGVDQVSLQMAGDVPAYCRRMADSVMPLLTGTAAPALGGPARSAPPDANHPRTRDPEPTSR